MRKSTMQTSKSLEKYQQYFDEYLSRLAQGKLTEALTYLDFAISECPVREAIPSLAARRATLVHDMTPIGSQLVNGVRNLFGRTIWKNSG